MPKRKLSEVTTGDAPAHPQKPKLTEQEYQHLKLQTTRLKQKFEFGVTSLSRALKAARGFERQKLGRRQKTAKGGPDAENAIAHAKGKAKGKGNVSPEETARRIEGEIQVLKTLDPVNTAEKYLFKQLAKTKRIAESPVFYRFKQSKEKKIKLEGRKSTEEANVTARLFKSNPVQNVLPGIMEGLRGLFGLEGAAAPKGKKGDKGKKEGGGSGKGKTSGKPEIQSVDDISGDESDSGSEGGVPVARGQSDVDVDMEDAESGEEDEDYSHFDGRLASDSENDNDDDDDLSDDDLAKLPRRSSMSISLSPSRSPSPPPKKAKSTPSSKTPATSTTFLPSLMMGGYWSGSESEAEDLEEAPKRKNRMGQQARRALWEKKYGAGANHVKQETQKGKGKNGKGRDSGWDLRKGATGDRDSGRRKWGTGSNAMAMSGKDRFGTAGGKESAKPKKPQDDKPLHPSWEAARKAKEQKATAAFSGKKVVFD
ncbi:BUD22 family protein [Aspergillus mulundensis]|uniref:Bud22 domain-containing protein n=1 Tax=Aspergillus mulundensis TaxID=1810919 RepID=A0A3D8S548_9EURO|nr:hypothetical protein DSM5745_04966 [Aspergillus mulundensis]RDW81409.1 hypothetical protein DSM5745_04966 [Aspergillus mulundensis]